MKQPAREPCMTLKELARLKGTTSGMLSKRAKKIPYPEPADFKFNGLTYLAHSTLVPRSTQYKRSELLAWFEATSVRKERCVSE